MQMQTRRFQRGLDRPHLSVRLQFTREFDDQNGVLRRQTERGEQPDLKVHVILEPAQTHGQQRADHTERHDARP